jgi:signal transduction histidine kinase
MSNNGTNIALFEDLTADEVALFYDLATRRSFADREVIIAEGEVGDSLYIVASGKVQVEKRTLDQQQEVLTSLDTGECFGELALVDREPRSATIRAYGQTEAYELTQDALATFFEAHPKIHRQVLNNLAKITAARIRRMDETLVQSVYDSIIVLDDDFRVTGWNRMTDRQSLLADADIDHFMGQNLFEMLPQLGEGVRHRLLQVMGSEDVTVFPLEFETDDEKIAYFDVTLAAHGAGVALGIRDVTDSKSLETRLIQAEKLAMAGQMSAEIGHELKNYLTVVMGHTELLLANPKLDGEERIERSLNAISDQLARMEQFASGLMDLAMLRSKTEPSSLNTLIEKLIAFIQGQSRFRQVEFSLNLDNELPLLNIDLGQIQQVLINLYANAADAMGKGLIETHTYLDGERVAVVVTDHGPGMSEDILLHIFDSGFTTKDTGHGFGLAICKRIIENHGGTVDVVSETGVGTTFTLTFGV